MILHISLYRLRQSINQSLSTNGRAMGCILWEFGRKITAVMHRTVTHYGLDNVATILEKPILNALSTVKITVFSLEFVFEGPIDDLLVNHKERVLPISTQNQYNKKIKKQKPIMFMTLSHVPPPPPPPPTHTHTHTHTLPLPEWFTFCNPLCAMHLEFLIIKRKFYILVPPHTYHLGMLVQS